MPNKYIFGLDFASRKKNQVKKKIGRKVFFKAREFIEESSKLLNERCDVLFLPRFLADSQRNFTTRFSFENIKTGQFFIPNPHIFWFTERRQMASFHKAQIGQDHASVGGKSSKRL